MSQVLYSIDPGTDLQQILCDFQSDNIFLLMDDNTKKSCSHFLIPHMSQYNQYTVPPGEKYKTLQTCSAIWSAMTHSCLDRYSSVINLGGGVICDIGGFCASTFKRGIRFIHCPTTLLAQVDACIGGKLGIDFEGYKNQIGIFREPDYVIISKCFLETLPKSELRNGYAEMTKHALLAGGELWDMQKTIDVRDIPTIKVIEKSLEFKLSIVSQDQKEKDVRKKLNFGHTIGHALEGVFLNSDLPSLSHGEAVAAGMVAEAYLSRQELGLPQSDLNDICTYIIDHFPPINLDSVNKTSFARALIQDKKNRFGVIRAALLKRIGHCVVDVPLTLDSCWEALLYYMMQSRKSKINKPIIDERAT